MSLIRRTTRVIRSKVNVIVGKISNNDPIKQLEQAEREMNNQLQDVTTSLRQLKTEKKRLENKADKLESEVENHNSQARQAMEQEREDLAREALSRKKKKQAEVEKLREQVSSLEQTEIELSDRRDQLKSKIQEFRKDKELKKTQYQTAKSRKEVAEILNGSVGKGVNADEHMERMQNVIDENKARAEAMRDMGSNSIDEELNSLGSESGVEEELDELRDEFGTSDDEIEVESVDTGSIENKQLQMELD